ncbi:MAG: LysR family transcriptional regulator [Lachnospiraceae bacterium]
MLNFLNLEYFLVAAEELNFTKAAKRLYISQQSLSNHIANIEKEFDVVLFNRTTPLTLTYAGQALMQKARQILDMKEETYQEIADIKDFTTGQLAIGVSHTRGRMLLPEVLPIYKEKFPNIDLKLLEGNSTELDTALVRGEVDLIIGMLPFKVDNIETVPVCDEEILMMVPDAVLERVFPENHEEILAKLEENPDVALLKDCPFLLINEGNRVRTISDELFVEAQITPKIALETENIETVMALARKGMGITFYPKMFISSQEKINAFMMEKLPLHVYSLNHPKAHGVLGIGYHKGHYMSRATKEFIKTVKEHI